MNHRVLNYGTEYLRQRQTLQLKKGRKNLADRGIFSMHLNVERDSALSFFSYFLL